MKRKKKEKIEEREKNKNANKKELKRDEAIIQKKNNNKGTRTKEKKDETPNDQTREQEITPLRHVTEHRRRSVQLFTVQRTGEQNHKHSYRTYLFLSDQRNCLVSAPSLCFHRKKEIRFISSCNTTGLV